MKYRILLLVWSLPMFLGAQTPFWEEIQAFQKQDAVSPPPEQSILFVGSSSIRLWNSLADDFPQHTVVNRGFGGSTLQDLNRYVDLIVIPYKPRQIFIYCGENDIAAGASAKTTFKRYLKVYRKIRKHYPTTPIVFISIKPSPSRIQHLSQVMVANHMILDHINKNPHIQYVDVFSKMVDPQGQPLPHIFVEDRLHMNPQGYQIWKDLIAPLLPPE